MDQKFTPYDLEPWYEKRKVLWRNIQLPGEGAGRMDAWKDHSQLYRLLQNADQTAYNIVKEEVNCRRTRKATKKWENLVAQLEETTKILEDWTVMYRLTYPV